MARRIKILFTIPNFDTAGSGKVVYDLVNGLDKTIFEPEICCFHDKGEFFKEIKALDVSIHLFKFTADYRPLIKLPYRIFKIYRFFKKHDFDLVHSWHWRSDFTEPLAAKSAGIPFVYTKKAMGWGNRCWTWRSKLSTKIITINSDMEKQFFTGMRHKVMPIPLGVNTSYFDPNIKFNISRADLNLKAEDFVIVSVANLVPVKGIELLLETVIRFNDPKVKVLVVGDDNNDYGNNIKTQYKNEQVLFLGKKQDVRPYLALSNLFVIPTKDEGRKEGLPIAPLEAMAMGVIVIGSDVSGISDILKEFPEHLFKAGNRKELNEKIEHIIKLSDDERAVISKQVRDHIEKKYDISSVVRQHQDLYKRLVV